MSTFAFEKETLDEYNRLVQMDEDTIDNQMIKRPRMDPSITSRQFVYPNVNDALQDIRDKSLFSASVASRVWAWVALACDLPSTPVAVPTFNSLWATPLSACAFDLPLALRNGIVAWKQFSGLQPIETTVAVEYQASCDTKKPNFSWDWKKDVRIMDDFQGDSLDALSFALFGSTEAKAALRFLSVLARVVNGIVINSQDYEIRMQQEPSGDDITCVAWLLNLNVVYVMFVDSNTPFVDYQERVDPSPTRWSSTVLLARGVVSASKKERIVPVASLRGSALL